MKEAASAHVPAFPGALWVGLGGLVGSLGRVMLDQFVGPTDWPAATIVVNLVGSGLLGYLVGRPSRPPSTLLWGVGALGSFTTFSAFAVESIGLGFPAGPFYVVGSVVGGLAAAWSGVRVARR